MAGMQSLGDTVARLLEWTGYEVEREYYFNNAGRQMRVLGDSVKKRYLQHGGRYRVSGRILPGRVYQRNCSKII
jgi:arginyl-tRNA synthetase